MTREEAIERAVCLKAWCKRMGMVEDVDALSIILSALRAQQEKNICGCTNLECASCTPGPCEHRKHPNAPLTNADHIRAMSDEEWASKIVSLVGTWREQTNWGGKHHFYGPDGKEYSTREDAVKAWLDWLQQPAEEADHEQ